MYFARFCVINLALAHAEKQNFPIAMKAAFTREHLLLANENMHDCTGVTGIVPTPLARIRKYA